MFCHFVLVIVCMSSSVISSWLKYTCTIIRFHCSKYSWFNIKTFVLLLVTLDFSPLFLSYDNSNKAHMNGVPKAQFRLPSCMVKSFDISCMCLSWFSRTRGVSEPGFLISDSPLLQYRVTKCDYSFGFLLFVIN